MTAAIRLADQVAVALRRQSWSVLDEVHLHAGIAAVLDAAGIEHTREVTLPDGAGRIDFLTAGGVGIEVKVAGAPTDVLRQLARYAAAAPVGALLLATTRPAHCTLPLMVRGTSLNTVLLRGIG